MRDSISGREIDVATQVQKLLLPKTSPTCSWGKIGYKNRMAQGVGGDFFDFLTMSDHCQVIILGDVTGHGLHASLVMALLYGYIHRAFDTPCPCHEIVGQLNDFLLSFSRRAENFEELFSATLFYGIINPEAGMLTYVNAGHPAPLLRRGATLLSLSPRSTPLGFFEAPETVMETVPLEKGDRLLLYTDGITEAVNCNGAVFGSERLIQIMKTSETGHLELLVALFDALDDFTEEDVPDDDCTAIVIDFFG